MNTDRRRAVAALTTAGLLWGTTVPLSKLALGWLPPGWLTFVRFGLAAAILLVAGRRQLRGVCTLPVLASGAAGYGGSVVIQNVGIGRTSVSHAALLIGATPVLVAVIAALWHRTVARPVAWAGFAVSLAGIGLVTGGGSGGGGATMGGDGLVLASLLASAAFTVGQAASARPRPDRGDRCAIPRRCPRGAAVLGGHRRRARRSRRPGHGPGHRRAGGRRHFASLHVVRLRAEPGARRGCRGLFQHRAARRRRGRHRLLRQRGRPVAGHRRRCHPRRHRLERPPAARRRPAAGAAASAARRRLPAASARPAANHACGAASCSCAGAGASQSRRSRLSLPAPCRCQNGGADRGCEHSENRVPRTGRTGAAGCWARADLRQFCRWAPPVMSCGHHWPAAAEGAARYAGEQRSQAGDLSGRLGPCAGWQVREPENAGAVAVRKLHSECARPFQRS